MFSCVSLPVPDLRAPLSARDLKKLRKRILQGAETPDGHALLRQCLLLLLNTRLSRDEVTELFDISPESLEKHLEELPAGDENDDLPSHEQEEELPEPADRPIVALRDIAAAAGVSVSTVSLALGGRSGVSEKTRAKVRKVSETMGYKPHPYVSSLMRQVGRRRRARAKVNLAWLHHGNYSIEEEFKKKWGNYPLYTAALKRARELGYEGLEPYWSAEPGISLEQLARVLKSRGIRGALMTSGTDKIPKLKEFSDLALVKLSAPSVDSSTHHVYPDTYQSVLLACARLWQSGYRRIGLLYGMTLSMLHTGNVEAAWFNFQHVLPEELRIPPFLRDVHTACLFDRFILQREPTDFIRMPVLVDQEKWKEKLQVIQETYSGGEKEEVAVREEISFLLMKQWLETYQPDAIVCYDSRLPQWVQQFNYSVPDDIGIAHLNLKADTPGWSGVDQHWEEIGRIAVGMLDQLIGIGQTGLTRHPVLRAIPVSWVEGETTPVKKPLVYSEDRYVDRWIKEHLNAVKGGSG